MSFFVSNRYEVQTINNIFYVLSFLYSVIMLNGILTFYCLRKDKAIQNRNVTVILYFGILTLISTSIERPSELIFSQQQNMTNPFNHWLGTVIIIFYCTVPLSLMLILYRTYLIFYNIKWN